MENPNKTEETGTKEYAAPELAEYGEVATTTKGPNQGPSDVFQ